jgi:hypothetical protein
MTVSMRVMSAGDGYKYLLKTIAAADGDRPLSTPLTRYYMEEGTPPGRWLGTGVAALGKGEIQVGDRVSEHQLQLLMGRAMIRSPTSRSVAPSRLTRARTSGSRRGSPTSSRR